MSKIAIVYASRYGQTQKIARRIAATLRTDGHSAELFDVARASPDLGRFQAIVVGAPVYLGKHPRVIERFVREHRALLERVPSAFYSVSLGVKRPGAEGRAQTLAAVDKLTARTGWRPERVELFAGSLPYTHYGVVTRFIMKRINAKDGDGDTSRDYEYTDWADVDDFAHELAATVAAAPPLPPLLAPPPRLASTTRTLLLLAGLASSLLYVFLDVLSARRYPGYDPIVQAVSELSAIGSPLGRSMLPLGILYGVLIIAFGLGVREAAHGGRTLRRVGALLVVYGALDFLWPFAPMHMRGATPSLTDTLHALLAAASVLAMFLTLAVGARALGRAFRRYTYATIVILLTFGVLTFAQAPDLAANQPTPYFGLFERINIGVFLVWAAVLSIALVRREAAHNRMTSQSTRSDAPRDGMVTRTPVRTN